MTLGAKHPWALGQPARKSGRRSGRTSDRAIETVLRTGNATWDEGLLLFLERSGYPEETYHTFSYSPLPDDDGKIGGMLCVVTEDTERVIGERRLATLQDSPWNLPLCAPSPTFARRSNAASGPISGPAVHADLSVRP